MISIIEMREKMVFLNFEWVVTERNYNGQAISMKGFSCKEDAILFADKSKHAIAMVERIYTGGGFETIAMKYKDQLTLFDEHGYEASLEEYRKSIIEEEV